MEAEGTVNLEEDTIFNVQSKTTPPYQEVVNYQFQWRLILVLQCQLWQGKFGRPDLQSYHWHSLP